MASSGQSDRTVGKIAWFNHSIWDEGDKHPWCEAPRHAGSPIRASYVVVFKGEGAEDGKDVVFADCHNCTQAIAGELGIPVEEGVLE
jgi:hypothetical protein